VARSNDILFTGRVVDADEALQMGLVSRVVDDDALLDECLAVAEQMTRYSPYGLAMTKDVIWANLEVASLEAAIELEDRNQLMLGFTENLPTAIRAFDAGAEPTYTDEPRRGMFPH
jgi:enoyl-CoA hydratase